MDGLVMFQTSGMRFGPVIVTALMLSFLSHCVLCHYMCGDTSSPQELQMPKEEAFCSKYWRITCCITQEPQDVLRAKFASIVNGIPKNERDNCKDLIQRIMCIRCNMFEAHLVHRSFPDARNTGIYYLCADFCRKALEKCPNILQYMYPPGHPLLAQISRRSSVNDKCSLLEDHDYCYPKFQWSTAYDQPLQYASDTDRRCACAKTIVSGLERPTDMRVLPDGTGRYLVTSQRGYVQIVYLNGRVRDEMYLNVEDLIQYPYSLHISDVESGLLSIAPHPEYKDNGYVFLCYAKYFGWRLAESTFPYRLPINGTYNYGKVQPFIFVVSRVTVSRDNPNKIDTNSEKTLLLVHQTSPRHNVNQLIFGPDGYMYISIGDGGDQMDHMQRAQNVSEPYGKILRIDVNAPDNIQYYIPADNPYANRNVTDWWEIYALGLRNAWRCSFDLGRPRIVADATGNFSSSDWRMLCGNTGESEYEEAFQVTKGSNHGWPIIAGGRCFYDRCQSIKHSNITNYSPPIVRYRHGSMGRAFIGGYLYYGDLMPDYTNSYVFADYNSKKLFYSRNEKGESLFRNTIGEIKMCHPSRCQCSNTYAAGQIRSFATDHNGELYILTSDSKQPSVPKKDDAIYLLSQVFNKLPVYIGDKCH